MQPRTELESLNNAKIFNCPLSKKRGLSLIEEISEIYRAVADSNLASHVVALETNWIIVKITYFSEKGPLFL
jgi:hypothetical protein